MHAACAGPLPVPAALQLACATLAWFLLGQLTKGSCPSWREQLKCGLAHSTSKSVHREFEPDVDVNLTGAGYGQDGGGASACAWPLLLHMLGVASLGAAWGVLCVCARACWVLEMGAGYSLLLAACSVHHSLFEGTCSSPEAPPGHGSVHDWQLCLLTLALHCCMTGQKPWPIMLRNLLCGVVPLRKWLSRTIRCSETCVCCSSATGAPHLLVCCVVLL